MSNALSWVEIQIPTPTQCRRGLLRLQTETQLGQAVRGDNSELTLLIGTVRIQNSCEYTMRTSICLMPLTKELLRS